MATATYTTVEKKKTVTEKVPGVTLTLDKREAGLVLGLLEKVAGPREGLRGEFDAIRKALGAQVYPIGVHTEVDSAADYFAPVGGKRTVSSVYVR